MDKKLTMNSFFTGIGGFDLGFQKVGFNIQYQCEINEFCNIILKKHWPDVNRGTDITKVKVKDIPKSDVWCAGFPCQDLSLARGAMGREGLKGKNSGLFYDFFKLLDSKRPEVVLIENVVGLLTSHDGNDFKIILQSLTNIGYGVSWRVFNTRYFGAPQSRPRVYICAWKNSPEKAMYALHEFEKSVKVSDQRSGFLTPDKNEELGVIVPQTAYCLAATSGRHTGTDWSRTYISYFDKVRRLTPSEAEKLQGFPAKWTVPNSDSAIKEKDIDSARYHAAGNAVSVPVVVWIAERIKKIKSEKTLNKGLHATLKKFTDFHDKERRVQFFSKLNERLLFPDEAKKKVSWKYGGIAYADEVIDCKVNSCPNFPLESKLIDIVDEGDIESKYFISPSAATGILRRVNGQGRKLFPPLTSALERLSAKDVKKHATC